MLGDHIPVARAKRGKGPRTHRQVVNRVRIDQRNVEKSKKKQRSTHKKPGNED